MITNGNLQKNEHMSSDSQEDCDESEAAQDGPFALNPRLGKTVAEEKEVGANTKQNGTSSEELDIGMARVRVVDGSGPNVLSRIRMIVVRGRGRVITRHDIFDTPPWSTVHHTSQDDGRNQEAQCSLNKKDSKDISGIEIES